MATTYYNDIQKLYVAYFNRPADPKGLAFWETQVEAAKGSTTAVAAAFAATAEYQTTYAGMTNAQIVNAVYLNLFGRPAEQAGVDFWADKLDKKILTIDTVVASIANGALNTDLTVFNNKVAAAAAFTAAVDTDAEIAGYNTKSAPFAKAFIASITTDASLANALIPANLNTTVGNVVVQGGTFNTTTALASLASSVKAEAAFLTVADGDNNAATKATGASLATAVTTKSDALVAALGANGTTYANGSAAVKAAIINDQIVANTNGLTNAQAEVTAATNAINAVSGLSTAISTLAAAKTAATASDAAELAATADLAAKVAAFNTLNSTGTVTVAADGTATFTVGTTVTNLITKSSSTGALQLATGVTETNKPGVTALLASSVTKEAADAAQINAHATQDAAQLTVNHLDVMNTTANHAEVDTLAAVATQINTYGDVTLATGAMPSEAQISTELSILTAKAAAETDVNGVAHTHLADFTSAVNAYHTAAAANPLVDALTLANSHVTTATNTITGFNTAVAAYNAAVANVTTYNGYEAQITAAKALFTANGYNLVDSSLVTGTIVATDKSDVFVVGSTDATINLFNLQGNDSLSIGTGYTLNTTSTLGSNGIITGGNDAVLEAFVIASNSGADTKIILETKAFGSSSADAEITITLTGVKAADVHLDANGIITVSH